jgi:hypothetical protein
MISSALLNLIVSVVGIGLLAMVAVGASPPSSARRGRVTGRVSRPRARPW